MRKDSELVEQLKKIQSILIKNPQTLYEKKICGTQTGNKNEIQYLLTSPAI
jgi:hypothetical protein